MAFTPRGSFPNAILHIDCDAFFASCEQAINPAYKGKPVITGKERGIVSAASYEAKAFGVKRGVPLWEVKKLCPDAIILPSNYETYSLFSKRMFGIIRRFTSDIEEYSIDEAFADITGLRRSHHLSYPAIALKIKQAIEADLGITVSVGLASSKVLAKVGSKWDKPSGFAVIRNRDIPQFLRKLPVSEVWGIGRQTTKFLEKHNITNTWQFASRPFGWVEQKMTKPHQEIWRELNGEKVLGINTQLKTDYASISKTKTFTPASTDREFVYGQLSKNVENAFIKVRRHKLVAQKLVIFLKTQQFEYYGLEARLNRPTAFPSEALPIVRLLFQQLFRSGVEYRATGAVLTGLHPDDGIQMTLFEDPLELDRQRSLFHSVDIMAKKYGKHTLFLGSSLPAHEVGQHAAARGDLPEAKRRRQGKPQARKFMDLPFWVGTVR